MGSLGRSLPLLGSFAVAALVILVAMTAVPTPTQSSSEPPSSSVSAVSSATSSGPPSSSALTTPGLAARVEFSQLGACSPQVYTTPWLVKLVGTAENGAAVSESEEQPVGANLSIYDSGGYTASAAGANFSAIVFPSVPVGTYNYSVTPEGAFHNPTGSLVVNGSANLKVVMEGPVVSCAANNAPLPLTSLGNVTTVDQARQTIGVSFSSPTFTPAGTTFGQVREREGMVALIYDNPSLPNLSTYSSGKIVVLIMKDNTSYVDPSTYASVQTHTTVIVQNGSTRTVTAADTPLSPTYQLVTVSGDSGWAFSPTTLSNGLHEDGRVEWWAGSVHYVILAELPASILVQIAESMNT